MDNKEEKKLREQLKKNTEAIKEGEETLRKAIKLLEILNK